MDVQLSMEVYDDDALQHDDCIGLVKVDLTPFRATLTPPLTHTLAPPLHATVTPRQPRFHHAYYLLLRRF